MMKQKQYNVYQIAAGDYSGCNFSLEERASHTKACKTSYKEKHSIVTRTCVREKGAFLTHPVPDC